MRRPSPATSYVLSHSDFRGSSRWNSLALPTSPGIEVANLNPRGPKLSQAFGCSSYTTYGMPEVLKLLSQRPLPSLTFRPLQGSTLIFTVPESFEPNPRPCPLKAPVSLCSQHRF